MIKDFLRAIRPNPLDRLLKKAKKDDKQRFLILWNRGLGDVPLGLYALIVRIRMYLPDAKISFLTRTDLKEVFEMLPSVDVIVSKTMKRGVDFDITSYKRGFDHILERVDPTRHLAWQLGTLTPELRWQKKWDTLHLKYPETKREKVLGIHLDTETGAYYGYEKNWPLENWKKVIENWQGDVIVFGDKKGEEIEGVHDLRGETTLFEMLSLIKNRCTHLLVPDSGVLSIAYYVAVDFPIKVVSLWADPHQGVLRQRVPSPNPSFEHIALIGDDQKIASISPKQVCEVLT